MGAPDLDVELVVCPPWLTDCPHLALACLSSYLRAHGLRTRVRDLNAELHREIEPEYRKFWSLTTSKFWARPAILQGVFSPRVTQYLLQFIDSLLRSPAPILGFSCHLGNVMFTLGVVKLLRERGCGKLIVLGGPSVRLRVPGEPSSAGLTGFRPSAGDERDAAEEIGRHLDRVDVLVEGEGEETLLDVARAHLAGRPLGGIPGAVAWRGETGRLQFVPRPMQPELDRFPAPTFEEFDLALYDKPFLPILTSRGCVRKCAMCYERILWPGFRHRSVEHIVAEMRSHLERHGVDSFCSNDLLLNGNLAHLGAVCDAIAGSGLPVRWWGNAVVHRLMDGELFARMRAGGIVALEYGIESGSQKVLRKMRKGYLIEDADRILRLGAENGIVNIINLIAGFPGESEDDHRMTLDFVRRNHSFIEKVGVLAECIVYPDSPLTEQAEYYGVEPDSLLQSDPFTFNTSWRDRAGMDESTRRRRFRELHTLIRGYGIEVVGVEDPEKLTPERIGELCRQLADSAVWVREEAAVRLRECAEPKLTPDLIRALDDESPAVASAALRALSSVDPERAWTEAARRIGRGSPELDQAALIALAASDRPESFDYMEPQLTSEAWRSSSFDLKQALAPFRRAFEPYESFLELSARLEGCSDLATADEDRRTLQAMARTALFHPAAWIRRRALSSLLERPAVARLLVPLLLEPELAADPDEQVRFARLERLIATGAELPDGLFLKARRDASPRVRALAIEGATVVHWRRRLAAGDAPVSSKDELAPLVAENEWARTTDWLQWLQSPPADFECLALIAARRAFEPGVPDWARGFTDWALATRVVSLQVRVLELLEESGRRGHEAAAQALLGSPNPAVRGLACSYLGSSGDRRFEVELAALLEDPDVWVSEAAAAALGQLESPRILPFLERRADPLTFGRLTPLLQRRLAVCREKLERVRALIGVTRPGDEAVLLAAFEAACPFERACLLREAGKSPEAWPNLRTKIA